MIIKTVKVPLVLSAIVLCILSCAPTNKMLPTYVQEKTKFKLTTLLSITESKLFHVGDAEGHVISLAKFEGTVSGGPWAGAHIVVMTFSDHIKGSGPHWGYQKCVLESGTVFGKWEGKLSTDLPPTGASASKIEGTITLIGGTGQFQKIQGGGLYKGKSPPGRQFRQYFLESEGEYFIRK